MNYGEFLNSLADDKPPSDLSPVLLALWYDGKGNWEASHNVAQDIQDLNGSWIHAYLHRKEGDLSNARYWYSMAGQKTPAATLNEEWENLVKNFLSK
jgi:hypothetical protein